MQEHGKLKDRSSQELQETTKMAYMSLPKDMLGGENLPYPEGAVRKINDYVRREKSEIKPVLANKFKNLISESPTTSHYKELINLLIGKVLEYGKGMRGQSGSYTRPLYESLQIPTGTGIYTAKGACEGERILYEWAVDQLLINGRVALMNGDEPLEPNPDIGILTYSTPEFKDFILAWHEEFIVHYGKPLDKDREL